MSEEGREVLNERQAAKYCDLSVSSFRKAVKLGRLPKPPDLGVRRRIWHKRALDVALGCPIPAQGGDEAEAAERERRKSAYKSRREDRARRAG
jgi:predicted DNA-binding transcriptional regulator AlpA